MTIPIQQTISAPSVVSEWWSVTAVSLNVGGGFRLIEPVKLFMCAQNTGQTHGAGMDGHGSVGTSLRESEVLNGRTAPRTAAMVVVELLFYVHGKHLRSCRGGQLPNHTFPGQA